MQSWTQRFLDLASSIANWSKDPSTKVGAVIADDKNRIVSVGFNGFPRGVTDAYTDRDEKLRRTIHAEENAILFSNKDLSGCKIFVTHYPCAKCAAKIVQVGIKEVYVAKTSFKTDFIERWKDDVASATEMFNEAGVNVQIGG